MASDANRGRLIVDGPSEGAWNMSVDQALLHSAENLGQTTLRFYQWSQPTLSLGYFQSHSDRESHSPSSNCSSIRRASGGGAIVHHHELTYSLSLPSSNRWSSHNSDLYQLLHRIVIQLINDAFAEGQTMAELYSDYSARVSAATDSSLDKQEKTARPFLCFLRRTDGDIVIGESKVVGSAQRRLKKSLIQHGSILLARSECAPELEGINDLGGTNLIASQIIPELVEAISNELKINFGDEGESESVLSKVEKASVAEIQTAQFGNQNWNERR